MLNGRVALITGAGRGIGREHALLFARLGAKVIVNDLGGNTDGQGADRSAAQAVVDEILAAGGEAIANTDSVTDFTQSAAIIAAGIERYGHLDVVVNNAGILRDRMLASMTEEEFDAVIDVHLKGTFNVSHHAAVHWRTASKDGDVRPRAIVNTSSGAGLHGNVGQTNYAAAKAGIAAMTIVHARELANYGVRVNGIAPIARTRLTLQTPGWDGRVAGTQWDAANISPLVAYLASEDCSFTGQMFSVFGGSVGIYSGWSCAAQVETHGRWTPQALGAAMEAEFPREPMVTNPFADALQASSS